ncbi:TetR/AcrR family transcriptional regulator C-terminal domain-containing protein [Pseudomonas aeruginosa]|jgi:AcrR family transcriptional regulator|nr:TetR/AcrR family transcriptional regulator C-terminal domain-containing protein [Pseudomonas aeruginosa]MCS9139086.1 TetR/AcrR family transcriptional regulator C-terminal domain-containing protein [Pseudomonas aeruginosa]MCS9211933.1 TetR/AcrR family transcriptional regulator C-terminal domain-containing protein [Pseudomonas aeruginosa]
MSAHASTTTGKAPRKRAGRRSKGERDVSRELMIACAIEIAQRESLAEVSMVRVGKALGVAPGMVHYHLGSRDALVSTMLNTAFKERVQQLPPLTEDWRNDLEAFARSSLTTLERWPGMATYILTENKFRLFQRVQSGETDYGLAYFDHIGRILSQAGLPAPLAAMAYHLLLLFISVIAAEKENHQAPNAHGQFIGTYLSKSAHKYPGACFLAEYFAKVDSSSTFDTGLTLLLDTFDAWRRKPAA